MEIWAECGSYDSALTRCPQTSGTATPTTTAAAGAASRPGKRAAPEPLLSVRATKRGRKKAPPPATPSHLPRLAPAPPPPPPPPPAAPPEARGRSSVESEDSRDTNGVGARADTNGSGRERGLALGGMLGSLADVVVRRDVCTSSVLLQT